MEGNRLLATGRIRRPEKKYAQLVGKVGLRLDMQVVGAVDVIRVEVGRWIVLILASKKPCREDSDGHILREMAKDFQQVGAASRRV